MINKDKPIIVKHRSVGATSMAVDKLKEDGYNIVSHEEITKFFEDMISSLDFEKLVYDAFYDRLVYGYYGLIPLKLLKTTETAIATQKDLNLINDWNDYYFGRKSNGRKD